MPHSFGDHVVLVKKSPDGVLSRVNAIVLASLVQPSNVNPREALRDHRGIIPAGEHLELIFPRSFANGQAPRARDLDLLFQRAISVPEWKDDLWIGWEDSSVSRLPSAEDLDAVSEEAEVKAATSGKVRQIKGK